MAMPTDDQRAHVAKLVAKWKRRFYLHQYEIHTIFHDQKPDADDGEDDAGRAFVKCAYADRYHHFAINFYPAFFEEDRQTQERMIVHELAHVPIEVLSTLIDRGRAGQLVTPTDQQHAVERITDWIANVIFFDDDGQAWRPVPAKKAARLAKRKAR